MIEPVDLKVSKKKEITTTDDKGENTTYRAELVATKGVKDIEKVTIVSSESIDLKEGDIVTFAVGRIQKKLAE